MFPSKGKGAVFQSRQVDDLTSWWKSDRRNERRLDLQLGAHSCFGYCQICKAAGCIWVGNFSLLLFFLPLQSLHMLSNAEHTMTHVQGVMYRKELDSPASSVEENEVLIFWGKILNQCKTLLPSSAHSYPPVLSFLGYYKVSYKVGKLLALAKELKYFLKE